MKKLIVILSSSIFLACSANQIQLTDAEYFTTAKVIHVEQKNSIAQDDIKIDFFGFSAFVSSKWLNKQHRTSHKEAIAYKISNADKFLILYNRDELMGCATPKDNSNEKDFCSAFKSTQEYYDKVWTLTPDDLKAPQYATRGNYMLVMEKKSWFTRPERVTAIYKYNGNGFTAYRRDFQSEDPMGKINRSELIIFPDKIAPNSISISPISANNDELFEQILSTIQ